MLAVRQAADGSLARLPDRAGHFWRPTPDWASEVIEFPRVGIWFRKIVTKTTDKTSRRLWHI